MKLIGQSISIILIILGSSGCAEKKMIGGDRDQYGCIRSAGYVWSQEKQKCVRPWEQKQEG